MKSKQRTLRITLSSILLAATLACGVTLYRYESKKNKETEPEIESAQGDSEYEENTGLTEEETTDVNTGSAQADQDQTQEEILPQEEAETSAEVLTSLDFNEGTLLNLPLSGETLIPYNMDNTVYFSTLDLYRCNPAMMIKAEVDTPVAVVANSKVLSITEDAVTGTTVTMDMGNGYQAVYGQLKDVKVELGETVAAGTVIANINTPTKYFVKEGSNLYFALTKEGTPLDPALYLPPESE